MIGSSFIVASSLALLLLSRHSHGGEAMEHLLAGQLLWVTGEQLLWALPVNALILCLWFCVKDRNRYFYPLFAITVTISVQLIGVYLVFANLILPALVAIKAKSPLRLAYSLATLSLMAGLVLSLWWDIPTGPLLVCVLALFALVVSRVFIRRPQF